MREDIDIRLLDYFYFNHSAVDKAKSPVVVEGETEAGASKSEEKHPTEPGDNH